MLLVDLFWWSGGGGGRWGGDCWEGRKWGELI